LENVSAILKKEWLQTVFQDLAARGYDVRWTCLPASAAGAPHYRDRWWCLAEHTDADSSRQLQSQGSECEQRGWFGDLGEDVADSQCLGCNEMEQPDSFREARKGAANPLVDGGISTGGIRWPTQSNLGGMVDELAFGVDTSWWEAEPEVGRIAIDIPNRAARIKALGNGQVPIQAALAWIMLGGPI
jgi:C-5 cytosine-specific DNA methylase.